MNHISEEELVLHYYREAEDGAAVERHLSACPSCRDSFREIRRVLSLADGGEVPERPEDYGIQVWNRIRPRLEESRAAHWWAVLRPPRWALAATMSALLVAAFLLGRYWPRPEPPAAPQSLSAEIGRRILMASVTEHLERSQLVLTDLVHAAGSGEIDLSGDRALARELLESNRIYRQSAARAGEPGLASVLDDLERTLLEIVHSPEKIDAANLGRLQREIESDGILFKLRVTATRMRERQTAAARELSRRAT